MTTMIDPMEKKKLSFLLILCFPVLAWAQNKQAMIRILQSDQSVLLDQYQTNIVLQKKSFKIQVMLENVGGIYAFAAFTDSICCRLSETDSIAGFMDLPERTMSEPDYNKEKELLVNDDNSCAYWYYDKALTWKGFNKKIYQLDNNKIVAVKSIKELYYVPSQKEIKLKDVRSPLYLFFVAVSEFDKIGKPMKELMRKTVRIDWIDED